VAVDVLVALSDVDDKGTVTVRGHELLESHFAHGWLSSTARVHYPGGYLRP
jgi:hypothetical protein